MYIHSGSVSILSRVLKFHSDKDSTTHLESGQPVWTVLWSITGPDREFDEIAATSTAPLAQVSKAVENLRGILSLLSEHVACTNSAWA